MLKYRNFGRKSLQELVDILSDMGLHFGMDVDAIILPGGEDSGDEPEPADETVEGAGVGSGEFAGEDSDEGSNEDSDEAPEKGPEEVADEDEVDDDTL